MKKWLLLLLLSLNLHAQTIEFVVGASPGGPEDITSRKISLEIENQSNLKIVIFNKPGASKTIGYNYVYQNNKPTLTLSSDTILQDKVKDVIEPLFYLGYSSNLVVTSSSSKINSIEDLISLSQKREIRFGHGGDLTQGYIAGKILCEKFMLNCLSVPYKSGPEVMIGLLSNTVDFFAVVSFGSENYINNDKYKPILLMSTIKHKLYDVSALPKKYKDIEQKKWSILFSKNLSETDKETIHNILKSLPEDFYSNLGYWYSYKDAKKEFK
jgi:tripartite-type tricarboxylate transporter receptor subunit TctC